MDHTGDGNYLYLPPLRDEYDALSKKYAKAVAALEPMKQRLEVLRAVLAFDTTHESPTPSQPPAVTPTETDATQPNTPPADGKPGDATAQTTTQMRARDLIMEVFAQAPAGARISTAQLHQRMRDELGYAASIDAVRRSAARLAGQGHLRKVGPGVWSAPKSPGGAVAN